MTWLRGWLDTFFRWLRPAPTAQAAIQCIHPSSSLGPCVYRQKGTTPGYKGAGWFTYCSNCGAYLPC